MADNAQRLVGFCGKIPACGDFVRQHIGDEISTALERWLSASTQSLYAGKHELGPEPVRFVLSAAGCNTVAIGALKRSVDSVGRSYPLAIFTSLSAAELMAQPCAAPFAYAGFCDAAERLLSDAHATPLQALRERVTSLVPPGQDDLEAATQRITTQLANVGAAAALQRALAGQHEDASYYALLTLCTATASVQLAAAHGAPTVLDCPVDRELGPALWLSLVAARLRWTRGAVSLLWAAEPSGRLLIALGAASDQLLSLYAAKQHGSTRLWPLTTERAEAMTRARTQLAPLLAALAPGTPGSVNDLAAQLAKIAL